MRKLRAFRLTPVDEARLVAIALAIGDVAASAALRYALEVAAIDLGIEKIPDRLAAARAAFLRLRQAGEGEQDHRDQK